MADELRLNISEFCQNCGEVIKPFLGTVVAEPESETVVLVLSCPACGFQWKSEESLVDEGDT